MEKDGEGLVIGLLVGVGGIILTTAAVTAGLTSLMCHLRHKRQQRGSILFVSTQIKLIICNIVFSSDNFEHFADWLNSATFWRYCDSGAVDTDCHCLQGCTSQWFRAAANTRGLEFLLEWYFTTLVLKNSLFPVTISASGHVSSHLRFYGK